MIKIIRDFELGDLILKDEHLIKPTKTKKNLTINSIQFPNKINKEQNDILLKIKFGYYNLPQIKIILTKMILREIL